MDQNSTGRPGPGSTLIAAKLHAPRRPADTVVRARLLAALNTPARVVLISAPAGFGKTVLLLDWLEDTPRCHGWLSVDTLDSDPDRFFAHFAACVRSLGSPASDRAALQLEVTAQRQGVVTADLLNAFSALDEDAVIVLDDVHNLEDDVALRVIGELTERLSSGPRFVILTRADPPFQFGRLRVRGELLEIREQDLRFSEAEAAEFFRSADIGGLAPEMAVRLQQRTEGWAAGLRLAAIALQRTKDPDAVVAGFSGGHKYVVDYLLEEALAGQSERIQRFLMDTSILPRFTAEACAAITQDATAGQLLAEIEKANLFLVCLDEERVWYRYHHLFAELLQFRLRKLQPDRIDALRARASEWFARIGELPEALDQASHITDRKRFAELLDAHAIEALNRSELAAFRRWLGLVPAALLPQHPTLMVSAAWFRLLTERMPDLEGILHSAEMATANPPAGYPQDRLAEARRQIRVIRATALRFNGQYGEAVEVSERLLEEMPNEHSMARALLCYNCASAQAALANSNTARSLMHRSFQENLDGGSPYTLMSTIAIAAHVHASTDGVHYARAQLRKAVSVVEQQRYESIPAFSLVHWGAGYLYYIENELALAQQELEAALVLSQGLQVIEAHANALVGLARVHTAAARFDAADARLTEAEALAFRWRVTVFGSALEIERAALETARSATYVASASPLDLSGFPVWSAAAEARFVVHLRQCLMRDQDAEAQAVAARLLLESEPRGRGIAICVARLVLALVESDRARRWGTLDEVLRFGARRRYLRPIMDLGERVRSFLLAGSANGLSGEAQAFADLLLGPWPADAGSVIRTIGIESLTDREREVLDQLVMGKSNKAIARTMFVSLDTVKTHLKHIYGKLGVTRRAEAIERAREKSPVC